MCGFVCFPASCIGTQFDLPTLATISGLGPREAAAGLWKAMVAGMIVAPGENYFVVQDDKDYKDEEINVVNFNSTATDSDSSTVSTSRGESKLSSSSSLLSSRPHDHPHVSTRDALRSIPTLSLMSAPQTKVLTTRGRLTESKSPHSADDPGTEDTGMSALCCESVTLNYCFIDGNPEYLETMRTEVSVTYHFSHDRVRQVSSTLPYNINTSLIFDLFVY